MRSFAVDRHDHVPVLDAGVVGAGAGRHLGHERTLLGDDAQLVAHGIVDPGEVDRLHAQERGVGRDVAATVAQLLDERLDRVDGSELGANLVRKRQWTPLRAQAALAVPKDSPGTNSRDRQMSRSPP